jgi:hypothetical protein
MRRVLAVPVDRPVCRWRLFLATVRSSVKIIPAPLVVTASVCVLVPMEWGIGSRGQRSTHPMLMVCWCFHTFRVLAKPVNMLWPSSCSSCDVLFNHSHRSVFHVLQYVYCKYIYLRNQEWSVLIFTIHSNIFCPCEYVTMCNLQKEEYVTRCDSLTASGAVRPGAPVRRVQECLQFWSEYIATVQRTSSTRVMCRRWRNTFWFVPLPLYRVVM